MKYSIINIATIINATSSTVSDVDIEYLLIDSRKIVFPISSLFFALDGPRRNGHQFINEIYERGVRNFVVKKDFNHTIFSDANFLLVDDVLQALQQLAAYHRQQFTIPVMGITGSNGKTIVKEWLYQLLKDEENIVRSPRSYNSQVGVPLSVWQMNATHTLGIFEAGISTVNEMQHLQAIIQPTIGIFTNISNAHSEGFLNDEEKIKEKLKLFATCKQFIYNKDILSEAIVKECVKNASFFTWSRKGNADVFVKHEQRSAVQTTLQLEYLQQELSLTIPFADNASIDNAITCICVLLMMNKSAEIIAEKLSQLQAIEMRLQLKKALNNCYVLNDSYSNDISSLSIALDYLKQQAGNRFTTIILSDILQSGIDEEQLYRLVLNELQQRNVKRFIGIGTQISLYKHLFINAVEQTAFYSSVKEFLANNTSHSFKDEFILLKGARSFEFETIDHWLEQKVHQTVMEIDLTAMAHNLKEFQKHLLPSTKVMAMVKAFSYGSGSAEVARVLQFHKVDYLAVAYADEGTELRKAGISLPIMVMNADEQSFDVLVEYSLEPEIYSFNMYKAFHAYLQQQGVSQFPVHIKVNTGMNRLGFEPDEIEELSLLMKADNTMAVRSVFSHLAGSESADHDGFTLQQATLFEKACFTIEEILGYTFIKHIANSAAIFRHKNLQYNMVRLGIGLYGVDSADGKEVSLQTVATLKTTIAQIRTVKAGQTVGYSRNGKIEHNSKIAVIRIGYADGFKRILGNGKGCVYVNGSLVPVVGNVCMDMVMIDVTNVVVEEGDEVEIFGKHLHVNKVAQWCGTIAYEVMTSISERVKRIYIEQ